MYESGYNKLFWGIIFIIFNINIGPINIMPNFIGYLFILSGINILIHQNEYYERAKVPAVILAITTIRDLINFSDNNILSPKLQGINLWLSLLGAVETLLHLYIIYVICKGIYQLAEERGFDFLRDSASGRYYSYIFISTIILFYTPFSLNMQQEGNIFLIIFAILNIISMLSIAGLFRKSRLYLGEGEEGY